MVVSVAQLVESWIVVPVVVGSNPIAHPRTVWLYSEASNLPEISFLFFSLLFSAQTTHNYRLSKSPQLSSVFQCHPTNPCRCYIICFLQVTAYDFFIIF